MTLIKTVRDGQRAAPGSVSSKAREEGPASYLLGPPMPGCPVPPASEIGAL